MREEKRNMPRESVIPVFSRFSPGLVPMISLTSCFSPFFCGSFVVWHFCWFILFRRMDALGSILFTLFLLLGIYVFFYEAVMALIRRVQYGDPVPVGAPPPEVVANHAREEEMIAQIGARRREQRHVGVQQRLQEEFLRWEQFNDLRHGSVGRRTGGGRPAFAPQPALSAAELERRRVVQEQDSEYQRALEADSELRRQEHQLKQEEAARLAQEAEARAREQEQ